MVQVHEWNRSNLRSWTVFQPPGKIQKCYSSGSYPAWTLFGIIATVKFCRSSWIMLRPMVMTHSITSSAEPLPSNLQYSHLAHLVKSHFFVDSKITLLLLLTQNKFFVAKQLKKVDFVLILILIIIVQHLNCS